MPKSAASPSAGDLPASNAARQRAAQRSDSSIERSASARSTGYGVHSSNTMTTSAPSARWTSIERSGVSTTFAPTTGELNSTPSSLKRRSFCRLQTWNPPESVKIGRSQCMNACRPPWARTTSMPGRNIK
jgi:hypothetical protein